MAKPVVGRVFIVLVICEDIVLSEVPLAFEVLVDSHVHGVLVLVWQLIFLVSLTRQFIACLLRLGVHVFVSVVTVVWAASTERPA